jgi:hypothetical protein
MATPFVQGRLRGESLSVTIKTECGHCGRPMEIWVDSDLRHRLWEEEARPLVFQPMIDWEGFAESNIIDAY